MALFRAAGLPPDYTIRLIFAICYGARTAEYHRHHLEDRDFLDFSKSFAGLFLQSFKQSAQGDFNIELYAYTGTVKFSDVSGELYVGTEEEIFQREKLEDLRQEWERVNEKLPTLLEAYIEEHGVEQFDRYNKAKLYLEDPSPFGQISKQYYELSAKRNELSQKISPKIPEYGRILHRSPRGDLSFKVELGGCFSGARDSGVEAVIDADESAPLLPQDDAPDRSSSCCSGCCAS